MIVNADKIGNGQSALKTKFQRELLEHWREIQENRQFPEKRHFRPQKFPKFLPQLAIVSIEGDADFGERLTGTTVSEILNDDHLVAPDNPGVQRIVREMLVKAQQAQAPIYFKGTLQPEESRYIPFTALILPFSHTSDEDTLDTLMLAFDFSSERRIDHTPSLERSSNGL